MRFIVLLAVLALALSATVEASSPRESAVVWQARSCVGEAGWRDYEACRAMTWVHMKRAREHSLPVERMVRLYSRAVRDPSLPNPPPRSRRWVLGLTTSGPAPIGWPQGPNWPRHRMLFQKMADLVDDILAGEVPDPCPDVIHYGGPMDDPHPSLARDEGCAPDSSQLFYRMEEAPSGGAA